MANKKHIFHYFAVSSYFGFWVESICWCNRCNLFNLYFFAAYSIYMFYIICNSNWWHSECLAREPSGKLFVQYERSFLTIIMQHEMHPSIYTQYSMMLSMNASISTTDESYERRYRVRSIVSLELQFHSIQFDSLVIANNQLSMTGIGNRHISSIALPILPTKLTILIWAWTTGWHAINRTKVQEEINSDWIIESGKL